MTDVTDDNCVRRHLIQEAQNKNNVEEGYGGLLFPRGIWDKFGRLPASIINADGDNLANAAEFESRIVRKQTKTAERRIWCAV